DRKRNYRGLVEAIGIILRQARHKAFQDVDRTLTMAYWQIGRHIVVYEQENDMKADYGSELLDRVAYDLRKKYGRGFSRSNVFNFRRLYLDYPKIQSVPGFLSWTHIVALLSVDDNLSRRFYERECTANRWSTRELERQIDSMLFEQYRVSFGNRHLYIDLVFYNRILRCFVLIDLKIGAISHQDIGQMNLYLNYFKKEEMLAGDNEPIGIVLGAEKHHILVEYALGGISNKLFASKYRLSLPDKRLLQKEVERVISGDRRIR
ncbi:MAG: PDDEXK nuclease domain-containing protein, partial [Nitrospirota bacterium]|nr:PDDEXK nuclease domain-containing protein [Nitrospirota bacterium]